jgi:putative transposase
MAREEMLTQRIKYLFEDFKKRYGSPRITVELRKEGLKVSEKTVGRIMKKHGLISCMVKKFKVTTTDSKHENPISPNLLNQKFHVAAPDQVWVTDITFIRTRQGMMYLASVLDLCTKKIVGWRFGDRMTLDLVVLALDQAYEARRPSPGLLHHSDRGAQYSSNEYRAKLLQYGMISSMSRKGNCYDNAVIESWHSTLKRELVYPKKFNTKQEALEEVLL